MTERNWCGGSAGGAVYGLGVIGVAVFYLEQATTLWEGIVGILKAFIWPGLLMYKVFDLLNL